ncbi:replication protein A 70 kDa DNA-binding subunit A [Tanacetum coccineum]
MGGFCWNPLPYRFHARLKMLRYHNSISLLGTSVEIETAESNSIIDSIGLVGQQLQERFSFGFISILAVKADENYRTSEGKSVSFFYVKSKNHMALTWCDRFSRSELILGCSAKDLYMLKSQGQDDERFSNAVKSRLFAEVLLKLKIKEETYGDEQRVKITVVKVDKMNHSSNTKYLLELIPRSY